ncbi:MAG: UDP-N-acetylglucosamine--N-acetylmuramyl-(pentapeptide) pyrophosphoryl-undecaprenol [Gaiellales bacterium]|nr:UDP-N-acetylglucosamine--N-acetylmuramyl-(pentapeptide) pyrophosphoryl-undecaprenol [Gaiellales bacterium]
MTARRVLVAAGGTAGHVMPALAVAEELVRAGAEVTFAGTSGRAEAEIVPAAGYAFDAFRVQGLPRRGSLRLARALAVDVSAPVACARILRRRRPHAVLGGGGFVAGPMLLAARALGIPRVLTEADAHLGLANRLAAPLADRVFLAYALPGREPPHYEVVGRPVLRAYFETTRAGARAELGISADAFVLAVFGALAGARRINDASVAAYGAGGMDGGIVLHVTGTRDHDDVARAVTASPARYRTIASTDRFWTVLAAADLAVSRAGGTVWELAAAGLPALLVPYPHATGDHQHANARHFAAAGGAVIVEDAALDGEFLRSFVCDLRAEPERLEEMRAGMRACARPEAAARVARELLRLAQGRQ